MPAHCGFGLYLSFALLAAHLGSLCLARGNPDQAWPEHYRVDMRLEPATHRISGITTIQVAGAAPELRFFLNKDLTVTAVRAGTNSLPFSSGAVERESRTLTVVAGASVLASPLPDLVPPPSRHPRAITIEYHGSFPPPGRTDPDWMGAIVLRTNEIRMTEQSKWFPMLEARRAPVQTTITLPSDLVLLSPVNARKAGEAGSHMSTWNSSFSKPSCPALIAGAFEVEQRADSTVNIALFPDQADKAELVLEAAGQIMNFMEARFGPAPFDELTVCQMRVLNPRYSYNFAAPAVVVLPTEIIAMAGNPERRPFWTRKLAHEIAHQWWGCSVDLPREPWTITESLAEFAAANCLQSIERAASLVDWFENEIEETQFQSFLARRGQPFDERTFRKTLAYRKGPLVLGMLRNLLGEDRFDAGLRELCNRHGYNKASMAEFRDVFGKCDPVPIDVFLEQWLERRVLPKVRVEVVQTNPIAFRVLQEAPLFLFPLEIEVGSDAGRRCVTCLVNQAEQVIETGVRGRVDWVRVDPQRKVLMEARDGVSEVGRHLIAATVEYDRMFSSMNPAEYNLPAVKALRDIFRGFMTAWDITKFRGRLAPNGNIDLKTEFELQRYERLREGLEPLAGGEDLGSLLREVEDAADDISDRIRDGRTAEVAEAAVRLKAGWERFCRFARIERFAE